MTSMFSHTVKDKKTNGVFCGDVVTNDQVFFVFHFVLKKMKMMMALIFPTSSNSESLQTHYSKTSPTE